MTETAFTMTVTPEVMEQIVEAVTARVLADLHRGDGRRLLPISAAAKELGMSEAALRKHVQRGNVPSVRVGSRVLVDMEALAS